MRRTKKAEKIPSYKIMSQRDLSLSVAKRYSADVYLKQEATLEQVKEVIVHATNTLIRSRYYRDRIVQKHFGNNKKADVIWLKVYLKGQRSQAYSTEARLGEVCSTMWVSPDLDERWKPPEMQGEEHQDIIINWCANNLPEEWRDVDAS